MESDLLKTPSRVAANSLVSAHGTEQETSPES